MMKLKGLFLVFLLSVSANSPAQFALNALDFDGTNDMVVVSSVPSFFSTLGSSDFTVEAWVNPRGSAFQRIFFAQPSTTNFTTFGTGIGNVIYFYVVVNGTTYSVATSAAIPQNQWTHVVARWTSATSSPEVFFNGVLQAGGAGGTSSTGTSGLMTLGTRPGGFQYFNGLMDELRVWNTARTPCQITSNMNRSITGVHANLVVNYDFNQGVAGGNNAGITALPDLSGNSYNGTLTNFTLSGATSNWVTSGATLTSSGSPAGGFNVSENVSVCSGGSHTFPDGTTQTNITAPVVYNSNLPGPGGCDTVVTTNVSVNPVYFSNDTAYVCSGDSFVFADGSSQTNITSPISHNSGLQTILGCDSIIVTYVDIFPTSSGSESVDICYGGSVTFPDGTTETNIDSSMVHTSTLQNIFGCDSIIVTTVNVGPIYALADSAEICSGESFTFPDGSNVNNITADTIYTSALSSVFGCDSVITTFVFVNLADTAVSQSVATLTAQAASGSYQWLDCGNGFAAVPGATGQSFTPSTSGSYALAITQNNCTDTSACYNITLVSSASEVMTNRIVVYPNPVSGVLQVDAGRFGEGIVELRDLSGALVQRVNFHSALFSVDFSNLAAGMYLLSISSSEGEVVQKVWKQ